MLYQTVAKERQKHLQTTQRPKPDFRGAALILQTSEEEDIALVGPAGTGKSFAALYKMHQLALRYPGFRGLIARKTRASLTTTGLVTFERFVLGLNHPMVVNGVLRRNRQSYKYPNGSEIEVGGFDPENVSKVLSAEYDVIYIQQAEEINVAEYEVLTTRLRSGVMPYSQLILDANPAGAQHWIKRGIDEGKYVEYKSYHKDNPTLYDATLGQWTERGAKYIARLARLTGVRLARLYKGLWVSAEGAVYPEFDPNIHLIDRFEIPSDWYIIRAIDFGYNNPFVCGWWAFNPYNGNVYLFREIYHTQRIVDDHAQQITELSQVERLDSITGQPVLIDPTHATITDHDANARATLIRYGIPNQPAYKDVLLGIEAVQRRLRNSATNHHASVNGLYFMRDSLVETDPDLEEKRLPLCTTEEIDGYVWKRDRKGTTHDEPVKKDDHGLDMTRYLVCFVDQIGAELEDTEETVVVDASYTSMISPV